MKKQKITNESKYKTLESIMLMIPIVPILLIFAGTLIMCITGGGGWLFVLAFLAYIMQY